MRIFNPFNPHVPFETESGWTVLGRLGRHVLGESTSSGSAPVEAISSTSSSTAITTEPTGTKQGGVRWETPKAYGFENPEIARGIQQGLNDRLTWQLGEREAFLRKEAEELKQEKKAFARERESTGFGVKPHHAFFYGVCFLLVGATAIFVLKQASK